MNKTVRAVVAISVLLAPLAACGGDDSLPGSLMGTWEGGNTAVHSVRFSDGGRLEINGGECHGTFGLSAVDGNTGDVDSGYIQCPPIMDGYIRGASVTVEGNSLTISGPVINGSYKKS